MFHTLAKLLLLALLAGSATSCSERKPPIPLDPPDPNGPSTAAQDASRYKDLPDGEPIIHRTQAGEPGVDGWYLAESTYGRFSVEMPGPFSDLMLKAKTTTGGIGVMHTVAVKYPDGTEFNVLKTESFGKPPPKQNAADQLTDTFQAAGATVTRTKIVLGGLRGERLSVRAKQISGEMVLLDAPRTSYTLGVQWYVEQKESFDADIEHFFNSFRIIDGAK